MAALQCFHLQVVAPAAHQRRDGPALERPAVAATTSGKLSWTSAMQACPLVSSLECRQPRAIQAPFTVHAAWTRRSKGDQSAPSKKRSWGQRADKYMKPFMLDVYISKKYVNAKVTHRVTGRVVSVATSNARDMRESLRSLSDDYACKVISRLLAERTKEADVYSVKFELRKNEKFEGKLALMVNTVAEEGITVMV